VVSGFRHAAGVGEVDVDLASEIVVKKGDRYFPFVARTDHGLKGYVIRFDAADIDQPRRGIDVWDADEGDFVDGWYALDDVRAELGPEVWGSLELFQAGVSWQFEDVLRAMMGDAYEPPDDSHDNLED